MIHAIKIHFHLDSQRDLDTANLQYVAKLIGIITTTHYIINIKHCLYKNESKLIFFRKDYFQKKIFSVAQNLKTSVRKR